MTDNTHRHWKGEFGNRHEHQNVWTKGGSKISAGRAPWALTPEMMTKPNNNRRECPPIPSYLSSHSVPNKNSQACDTTSSENVTNKPRSSQTLSERRRSSAGSSAGLFSKLQTQKRESGDAGMVGRRESWNEQREQGRFLSKLWDEYTRGK